MSQQPSPFSKAIPMVIFQGSAQSINISPRQCSASKPATPQSQSSRYTTASSNISPTQQHNTTLAESMSQIHQEQSIQEGNEFPFPNFEDDLGSTRAYQVQNSPASRNSIPYAHQHKRRKSSPLSNLYPDVQTSSIRQFPIRTYATNLPTAADFIRGRSRTEKRGTNSGPYGNDSGYNSISAGFSLPNSTFPLVQNDSSLSVTSLENHASGSFASSENEDSDMASYTNQLPSLSPTPDPQCQQGAERKSKFIEGDMSVDVKSLAAPVEDLNEHITQLGVIEKLKSGWKRLFWKKEKRARKRWEELRAQRPELDLKRCKTCRESSKAPRAQRRVGERWDLDE